MEAAVAEAPRPRVQDGFLSCFTISTLLSCKFKKTFYLVHWIQLPTPKLWIIIFRMFWPIRTFTVLVCLFVIVFWSETIWLAKKPVLKFSIYSSGIGCWIRWARYVNLLSFASVKCNLAHRFGRKGHGLPQGHQGGSGKPVDKRMTICNRDGGFGSSAEISAIPKPSGELNGGWALHPSSRRGHERCAGIAHWIIFSSEVTH